MKKQKIIIISSSTEGFEKEANKLFCDGYKLIQFTSAEDLQLTGVFQLKRKFWDDDKDITSKKKQIHIAESSLAKLGIKQDDKQIITIDERAEISAYAILILAEARRLITDPKSWCKDHYTETGFKDNTCFTRYSLYAATYYGSEKIYIGEGLGFDVLDQVYAALVAIIDKVPYSNELRNNTEFTDEDPRKTRYLVTFNEHPQTTHRDVLNIITDAIDYEYLGI